VGGNRVRARRAPHSCTRAPHSCTRRGYRRRPHGHCHGRHQRCLSICRRRSDVSDWELRRMALELLFFEEAEEPE
jgi:hypothetical protein